MMMEVRRCGGPVFRALSACVVIFVASLPASLAGQLSVAGRWEAKWAQAVQTDGNVLMQVQRWGDATLMLMQEGGQVTGTWRAEDGGVTWTVSGELVGDRLTLGATEHDSTDPELALVRAVRWEANLVDGQLAGEMWMEFSGRPEPSARRPWEAALASVDRGL